MKTAKLFAPIPSYLKTLYAPLLLTLFFITGCCKDCPDNQTNSNETELWNGKYAKGMVLLNAQSEETGLIAVNLLDSYSRDRYLCVYKYNSNTSFLLNDTVYIKASNINGIPIATEILKSAPPIFEERVRTNMVEHRIYAHGGNRNLHVKTHIIKQTSAEGVPTYEVGGLDLSTTYTISNNSPLYNKAISIFIQGTIDSQGRIEIFFSENNSNNPATLESIDLCHYHNGVLQGCL